MAPLPQQQRRKMSEKNKSRRIIMFAIMVVVASSSPAFSFQSSHCQHQQLQCNQYTEELYLKGNYFSAPKRTNMRARQISFATNKNSCEEGNKDNVRIQQQQQQSISLDIFQKIMQNNAVISSSFAAAAAIFVFSFFSPVDPSIAMTNDNAFEGITSKVIAAPISTPTTYQPAQSTQEPTSRRYWSIQSSSNDPDLIRSSNMALLDHAVGTINTMYYDSTGGAYFDPRDMYDRFRALRILVNDGEEGLKTWLDGKYSSESGGDKGGQWKSVVKARLGIGSMPGKDVFDSREKTVDGLKWLVSTLNDPFSKYLTREELRNEFLERNDGFLGLGVFVEPPQRAPPTLVSQPSLSASIGTTSTISSAKATTSNTSAKTIKSKSKNDLENTILTYTRVANLPVVTAVAPDSPAERAGIVVGDRIASVGADKFMGMNREEVSRALSTRYNAENYVGYPDITIVKPVKKIVTTLGSDGNDDESGGLFLPPRETVTGYRLSRVRLPTSSLEPFTPFIPNSAAVSTSLASSTSSASASTASLPSPPPRSPIAGGDAIVHYELLTPTDTIFGKFALINNMDSITTSSATSSSDNEEQSRVGYIRLTRFSRASTAGYMNAISKLEEAGAKSYIIDVRNNYGGIIQEAMLSASTLLRDPHMVLCYTMNSRGGFTPHDVEEYIVDKRFPGYLLSSEDKKITKDQVAKENPEMFEEDGIMWVPPSSFASLHEQRLKRGLHLPTAAPMMNAQFVSDNAAYTPPSSSYQWLFPARNSNTMLNPLTKKVQMEQKLQRDAQKKVVILMNEGTASSAEFFASALRDNGRVVALVGAKTYGKGLIQHTFPMPDGGGLRLTVAEYLTPTLQHVTKVGSARYDRNTGELVGGGIRPDIYCPSNQGIPKNVGSDICVGMALDALEDAKDI